MSTIVAGRRARRVVAERRRAAPAWTLAAVLLLSGVVLSACEEDDDEKTTSAPAVNFVYVTSNLENRIYGLLQDKETGVLSPMDSSPFNGINQNRDMIAHPSLTSLILDQWSGGSVLVKSMDAETGLLGSVQQGILSVAGAATAYVGLTPDGSRLYGTDDLALVIRGYDFDESTRVFTQQAWSPLNTGLVPNVAALDATGNVFALVVASGDIHSYLIDSTTGVPTVAVSSPLATAVTGIQQFRRGSPRRVLLRGDEHVAEPDGARDQPDHGCAQPGGQPAGSGVRERREHVA